MFDCPKMAKNNSEMCFPLKISRICFDILRIINLMHIYKNIFKLSLNHLRTCNNAVDAVASVGLMCSAIDDLSKWMASNHLLLNPSNTQFIWLGGRRQLAKVDLPMLADTFPHVAFSTTVQDLGLTPDQELNFSDRVNLITRSCYYHL